jgi:hypothetical protein
MSAGTLKDNAPTVYLAKEPPLWPDVTFTAACIVTDKLMVPMLWIRHFAID